MGWRVGVGRWGWEVGGGVGDGLEMGIGDMKDSDDMKCETEKRAREKGKEVNTFEGRTRDK